MNLDSISLRDYFAALAMQSFIAYGFSAEDKEKVVAWAYQYADAMVKASDIRK